MKKIMLPMAVGLAAAVLLLAGMWMFYEKSVKEIEEISGNDTVYDKHYIMISDDASSLWQSIYENARRAATEENVYLEWVREDNFADYSVADCLNIGIASRVDGIILCPDGTEKTTELINEAAGQGIPVVTVLDDDKESQRISFVGINSYQLGEAYGEQVLNCLQEGENRILVLIDASSEDVNTNIIYARINEVVEQGKKVKQQAEIATYEIDSSTSFDAEESIRDIFLNLQEHPDILICLDAVSTECAYQAIVDYNEVGNVDIIGYYASDVILDAIQKELMPVTIALDTSDIGRYSINALNEYQELGYVSNYFSVGLNIITKENVRQFIDAQ